MTINQAIPLIENKSELLQTVGINLFCSVRVAGFPGNGLPYIRLFKILFGIWSVWWGGPDDYVKIYNPIIGIQFCEDKLCKETSGKFIGLIAFFPPAIYTPMIPVTPCIIINGLFTLFSRSNVPFVTSNLTSEKSICSCNN